MSEERTSARRRQRVDSDLLMKNQHHQRRNESGQWHGRSEERRSGADIAAHIEREHYEAACRVRAETEHAHRVEADQIDADMFEAEGFNAKRIEAEKIEAERQQTLSGLVATGHCHDLLRNVGGAAATGSYRQIRMTSSCRRLDRTGLVILFSKQYKIALMLLRGTA